MGIGTGGIMALLQTSQAASGMANANAQAGAYSAQGRYAGRAADFNATMADMGAADALARGEAQQARVGQKAAAVIGEQRAAVAGGNVDVNSGSALDLQAETSYLSALDRAAIANNASKEAFGFKMQALNDRFGGRFARISARGNANQTMIGGVANTAGKLGMAGYMGQRYGWLSPDLPGPGGTDSEFRATKQSWIDGSKD